jgi:purine-binding chemotaxis protein CheW
MGKVVNPAELFESADQRQYLTFSLGGEMFAVGILAVKEIIEYGNVTPVPMMPECIRGVINLRGAVVPVVDLACRFGRPAGAVTRRTCIVIIEIDAGGEQQDVGVVVDAVSAVLEIRLEDVEPPPSFGTRIRTDFIQGMGKIEDRFVIILSVDKVLSLEDLSMLGRAAHSGREPAQVPAGVAA